MPEDSRATTPERAGFLPRLRPIDPIRGTIRPDAAIRSSPSSATSHAPRLGRAPSAVRFRDPSPPMIIYGTALLAICQLLGIVCGDLLGRAMGLKTNVGGVGIAMLLLISARLWLLKRG